MKKTLLFFSLLFLFPCWTPKAQADEDRREAEYGYYIVNRPRAYHGWFWSFTPRRGDILKVYNCYPDYTCCMYVCSFNGMSVDVEHYDWHGHYQAFYYLGGQAKYFYQDEPDLFYRDNLFFSKNRKPTYEEITKILNEID